MSMHKWGCSWARKLWRRGGISPWGVHSAVDSNHADEDALNFAISTNWVDLDVAHFSIEKVMDEYHSQWEGITRGSWDPVLAGAGIGQTVDLGPGSSRYVVGYWAGATHRWNPVWQRG